MRLAVVAVGLAAVLVVELVFHRPRNRRRMAVARARLATNGGVMDPNRMQSDAGVGREAVGDPANQGQGFRNQQETPEKVADRFKINSKGDPSGNLHQLSLTATDLAKQILELAPPGRERATALTNLEQCFFWLQASVTRYGLNG
jgi:hypothetical protein